MCCAESGSHRRGNGCSGFGGSYFEESDCEDGLGIVKMGQGYKEVDYILIYDSVPVYIL